MSTAKLTIAQRKGLEAVARGSVWRWVAYDAWAKPKGVNSGVLNRLLSDGLIRTRPTRPGISREWRDVVCTQAGREAL